MKTADFDFDLPSELIALRPSPQRDGSRLLVLHSGGNIEHRSFSDITDYLADGDMLVLNDTRVLPVRLIGQKASGGKIDIILVNEVGAGAWQIICRGRYEGNVYFRGGVTAEVYTEKSASSGAERERHLRFTGPDAGDIQEILGLCGSMPLPPYIRRLPDAEDIQRYQTVYADSPGSIAAPTAGLHFTERLLDDLSSGGIMIRRITLHVGPGTFRPITVEEINDHAMQSEYFEMESGLPAEIMAVKAGGKKVFAVGTTATRALEGFLGRGSFSGSAGNSRISGCTDIFIKPGHKFLAPDSLLTNFHLPRSTPLMLAAAFCGFERLMAAYREAIARDYRFFSYGDAMLIL
jgi:S-adenosylmethionine:tRNA ribosyltransferase-isomerase